MNAATFWSLASAPASRESATINGLILSKASKFTWKRSHQAPCRSRGGLTIDKRTIVDTYHPRGFGDYSDDLYPTTTLSPVIVIVREGGNGLTSPAALLFPLSAGQTRLANQNQEERKRKHSTRYGQEWGAKSKCKRV